MCPYGIVTKQLAAKKAAGRWMVKAEHPERFSYIPGGRTALLEDSAGLNLRGKRVLYCNVILVGGYYIAKRWDVLEDGPKDSMSGPRTKAFADSGWVVMSIRQALAHVQVPGNAALVLYDPLFFGSPVMHGQHRLPLDFLALAYSGQLAENAAVLLSLMECVSRVRQLPRKGAPDGFLEEARRRLLGAGNSRREFPQNGLFTACYKTTFNPPERFASHVSSNSATWGMPFIPVKGLVLKRSGWPFIEAEVIARCVERLTSW